MSKYIINFMPLLMIVCITANQSSFTTLSHLLNVNLAVLLGLLVMPPYYMQTFAGYRQYSTAAKYI